MNRSAQSGLVSALLGAETSCAVPHQYIVLDPRLILPKVYRQQHTSGLGALLYLCACACQALCRLHQTDMALCMPGKQSETYMLCMFRLVRSLCSRAGCWLCRGRSCFVGCMLSETVICVQVATVQTSYQMCFEDVQCATEKSWALLTGRKQ